MALERQVCRLCGPRLCVAGFEQAAVGGCELVETGMKESGGRERSGRNAIEDRARELAGGNPIVVMQLALDGQHALKDFLGGAHAAVFRVAAGRFPGANEAPAFGGGGYGRG